MIENKSIILSDGGKECLVWQKRWALFSLSAFLTASSKAGLSFSSCLCAVQVPNPVDYDFTSDRLSKLTYYFIRKSWTLLYYLSIWN